MRELKRCRRSGWLLYPLGEQAASERGVEVVESGGREGENVLRERERERKKER
jgi:hypothetical protein